MALLVTSNGFQLYLHADNSFRHRDAGTIGVQYLMWAIDGESEVEQIAQRLKAYDAAAYSYAQGGVHFVEGCGRGRERVIIAYPSPRQLPREVIAKQLRGGPGSGSRLRRRYVADVEQLHEILGSRKWLRRRGPTCVNVADHMSHPRRHDFEVHARHRCAGRGACVM